MLDEASARAFCGERVGAEGIDRLEQLAADLAAENARQNLVSAATLSQVWRRHFADSAQLLDHVPRGTSPLLDLGSGAGLPGLVLAIGRPCQSTLLIESRKRRVEWLERCVGRLGLNNCQVIGARLENVATVSAGGITARAFAPLDKLLRLSARFSTPDTVWVLPKGRSAAQELREQPAELRKMFHVEQSQIDPEAGIVIGRGQVRQ